MVVATYLTSSKPDHMFIMAPTCNLYDLCYELLNDGHLRENLLENLCGDLYDVLHDILHDLVWDGFYG